jgi:hypothetical protein
MMMMMMIIQLIMINVLTQQPKNTGTAVQERRKIHEINNHKKEHTKNNKMQ